MNLMEALLSAKLGGSGGGGGGGAVSSVNGKTGAVVLTAADLDDSFKGALLACFAHVAWTDEHGPDYINALEAALYPSAGLVGIAALYTQSGTVYDTDSLDSLRADLVVTATYANGDVRTVSDYVLSGTLAEGTSTITVLYGGKTTTFDVTVTHSLYWKILNIEQDFIDGGLKEANPYENTTRTDRCSYAAFDLLISPDYTYTFEYGTGARMGVPWYTSDVFQLVQNNQSINSVKTDPGWKNSGYSFTPGTDGACMRITFDKNKTDVLSAGITEVKITRTAVNEGG